jgi:hypothetical protein
MPKPSFQEKCTKIPIQLETRNQTASNNISARISEQSRDIARESKRDSRAMKAIAVLTMFFLPGTFVAVRHFIIAPFQRRLMASEIGFSDNAILPMGYQCFEIYRHN